MIEVKNISKLFGEYTLFENFSYNFTEGNSYAIIGESGSGKTTLLNIIGKLESINSGEIIVNGESLTKLKERHYFKDYVSFIFQNYGLIENQTIQQNLDLAFVGKKLSVKEKIAQMKQALAKVNLNLELNRKIFTLSGGESQRVAIAKAILKDSFIILADEPTASLDEKNSLEILNLILGLQNENRIIIVATHDPIVYNRLSHTIVMKGNKNEI